MDRYDSKAPLEKSSQHIGASCYKDRCIMIYVAPWCTYCRRSHQAILSTVKTLESRGIPVFVVLGMDKIDKLKDYAAEFPFPVYCDRDRHFFHHLNGKADIPHHFPKNFQLPSTGIPKAELQFRDMRPKAATEIDGWSGTKEAQGLLGQATEQMSAHYIRYKKGKLVKPSK